MDSLIRRFDFVEDDDLRLCEARGIAYQSNMSIRVQYDDDYFGKCLSYEDKDIAIAINKGRIELTEKYGTGPMLDIGVGSGEFVKKRNAAGMETKGYDVNPKAREWLTQSGLYSASIDEFNAFSFWDVLEHVDMPETYFRNMPDGSLVFVSIPVFSRLAKIRASRHYRPGEHLYYFTDEGFTKWMGLWGFRLLERQDFEISAGRESIYSYAFKKDLPGYHETLGQYVQMHGNRHYGSSSMLYFDVLSKIVLSRNPSKILDFGCGRSDLVAHFWADGRRELLRYDPAIADYKEMPPGTVDLVLCNDVMEHILMRDVENIFREIRAKSQNAVFTISLRPARTHLPDGRNAHVTLLTKSEWLRWITDIFGVAREVPCQYDHILIVRTF